MKEIYESGELIEMATARKIRVVRVEGIRQVTGVIDFFNLDAIISVVYRVNTSKATQFRIWATQVIRENAVLQQNTTHYIIFRQNCKENIARITVDNQYLY